MSTMMFDKLRRLYSALYKVIPFLQPVRLRVLRYRSGKLLDVGCGRLSPYRLYETFGSRFEYYGVDIEDIRAYLPEGWHFTRLDIEKEPLPFPDDYFDVVIVSHVIEHLHYPVKALREVLRVVKRDGLVYFETPSINSLFIPSVSLGLPKVGTINFYDDPTHIRPYSKVTLARLLEMSGFRVLKTGTHRNWLKILVSPVGLIIALISRDRSLLASFMWDIFGFAIFCIATKSIDGD